MTAPTQPTPTTLATEALTRFQNGGTPDSAEVSRAVSYGLEKVKRDIMLLGQKWRPLLTTVYDITVQGVSHYANPSDFEADFSASLMKGTHTDVLGIVTSASQMALAATEDMTQAEALGRWLLITSGTGINQAQQIKTYSATTKVAVLDQAYSTSPLIGDGYLIVTQFKDLRYKHPKLYDRYDHPGAPGEPKIFTNLKDSTNGQFVLYPVPDATYGVRRKYYADLRRLDTAGTVYSTILRRWASILEQGIYVWKLGEDDDRYSSESQIYMAMLQALAQMDLDGAPSVTASTKTT